MSRLFRRSKPEPPAPPGLSIRDTLFGDLPWGQWAGAGSAEEPWASFKVAADALDRGDHQRCVEALRAVLQQPELESRHYLQAWHFLRPLGVRPPDDEQKRVYGVVVEVPMDLGEDLLAAYADLTARYYNFSGAGVVWERPDDRLDDAARQLLEAGEVVAREIGPWEDARPGPPPAGAIRINMLTPSGLHFGQAPFQAMSSDPLGGPVVAAATRLMQALMALHGER